jgi:hypothetical protein
MEGRIWEIVRRLLSSVQEVLSRDRYSTREILAVGLWAVLHDRPFCWACAAENWPPERRPRFLPSPSTLSRRWRSERLAVRADDIHRAAVALLPVEHDAAIDGKPLIVSDVSQDWQAKNGRGTRGFARGYKLHAVVGYGGAVVAFEVRPLNENERRPAARLLPHLPRTIRRIAADGNYDSSQLHRVLEGTGVRLYTPILNDYASPRTHPRRRLLLRLMRCAVGRRLKHNRDRIERSFARLCNVGFGLKGLPSWARGLHRVRRWIWGKILLYHAWLLLRRNC